MRRAGPYLALLRDRRFRSYWLSQATGDAGYAVYAISVVWLGYRLSGSSLVVGAILGVEFGVYAASFLAGAVVDRVQRLERILRIGYPLQAIGAFLLGLLLVEGLLTVPLLLLLVALISLVWDFTWTANNTLPPFLVDQEHLLPANSLVSAASGGNQIAGYAVGGALLLVVGPAAGQFLYAALNIASLLLILPLRSYRATRSVGRFGAEFRAGWSYLFRPETRPLRDLALFGALEGVLSLAPPLLITLLSVALFPSPETSYGVLFTAYAVGGVAGSLLLGAYVPRQRLSPVLFGSVAAEGSLILLALLAGPLLPASAVAWFGVGLCDIALWTVVLVVLQARAPPALLGRTITNSYFFRGTARAAGAVLLGTVGAVIAAPTLAELSGGLFVLAAIAGWALFPSLREMGY